ncbi:carbamoyl-phosphate synthase large subunit [Hydrogenophaga taeniospiralis]|uniref:acetyl/propionyl/methylcrotonyl-CoA carboxylase subunit alpha n=1 Tax=Hydrogenophaga taeniospiralis TaxID=65656 RepID=UPI001CF99944|nr:biotin carboxylase N-terminal domain-containing protein [Hydrogenophaga taeniospiralis]MCB4363662.1 carbamoyl-phosphate synthase large subunit [Hydrogenophaga taeniospiralis]
MKKLLIGNRGEIARRIIRSAHAMGIATVAVYSDADRDALHVREAGSSFALGGLASADSYLRVDKLLEAARATGADAVHPGYGFLSENADFAQAVIDAGFTWVGPPPAAIRALGSKSAAKALAHAHGVPCLLGYSGDDQRDETFIAEAQCIGFPLMVKAVAGGGGRGMRLVHGAAQLLPALHSARSEALSGFGNAELLIERALLAPRHVEVQVFADAHGHCIHLGERDCSVQRRHQKIIEEAPSPAVSPALRAELGRCAVALAQAAGYVGAGTVEFLLDDGWGESPHPNPLPQAGEGAMPFFLMEMNTRLQVEHPVTEMITGLDLVEWQIRVARGEPLPLTQEQVRFSGHAIEVRLCAEDEHHTPHTGRVRHFAEPPMAPGLRFDHALETGAEVTPHYDAMLGKLIAHAPTRAEAVHRLAHALDHTRVLGLPTNRAFLAACLRHPVFGAGGARIPFLAEHGDALREGLRPAADAQRVAALALLYAQRPPASALACPFPRGLRLGLGAELLELAVQETAGGQLVVTQGDRTWRARLRPDAGGLRITLDGVGWVAHAVPVVGAGGAAPRWQVQLSGGGAGDATRAELWLDDLSHTPRERAGGAGATRELRAPFNGKLVALHAQEGQAVLRGAPLLVIESMKLEHTLAAPRDAVIESLNVAPGQQVSPGQLLATFE